MMWQYFSTLGRVPNPLYIYPKNTKHRQKLAEEALRQAVIYGYIGHLELIEVELED